ncbi:MAG: DUF1993 domain-containing protein [Gammaproteobacteria bacterium]|nr:DUF1993 domain-containing protein [Gammaproteobacteria bacterium]
MKISTVFQAIINQQLPALIIILDKANTFASDSGTSDETLLAARLHPDMHPLSWQIQTTLELLLRSLARLSGREPESLLLDEKSFVALIDRVKKIRSDLASQNLTELDASADHTIQLPIGPEQTLTLSGQDYLLKFLLPNFYFHLTTTYDILRMSGVPLGKRDYMGPIG